LSYFEEYSFKFNTGPEVIVNRFKGEKKQFVAAIMDHCRTLKIWTVVDMPSILKSYGTDRQRIAVALEYFDEKGWIELQSRQAVEVFDILTQAFRTDDMAEKMFAVFKKKELLEIQRIHAVVRFLESNGCLSKKLAEYFGETLEMDHCGHCSFCKKGKVVLQHATDLKPLSNFDFGEITGEFTRVVVEQNSEINLTKFLCGIYAPVFSKLKIKKLPHFGILDSYPFLEVRKWIRNNRTK
jgi:ATP-dependent DNA helicase RecQ